MNLFEIFGQFQRIEKLYIVLKETNYASLGSVESLEKSQKLNSIRVRDKRSNE
jgi:hypothetical protein